MTTLVLGAGFARTAGVPVQSEVTAQLLATAFDSRIDRIITRALERFLTDVFGWQEGRPQPSLEDVFTCIDLSADTGHHLGRPYSPRILRAIRRMAMYRIFTILDRPISHSADIDRLLQAYCRPPHGAGCHFVVLNWDLVLERHLRGLIPEISIDYRCPAYDWSHPGRAPRRDGVAVCKMHGSSNWVYCDNCKLLFYDLDGKLSLDTRAGLLAADLRLFDPSLTAREFRDIAGVTAAERGCRFCGTTVSPHVATFSFRKSFRTPAYPSIWYHAERLLAESARWVFVGYSLPDADYELKHLLKAAQLRLADVAPAARKRVEVIVHDDRAARDKFHRFFGAELIHFVDGGLAEYARRLPGAA